MDLFVERLFDGDSWRRACVRIDGDCIAAVEAWAPDSPADGPVLALAAPGFVDVHSHGGGGASFVTDDLDDVRTAVNAHRAHGTTTMIASLVTGAQADLLAQVRLLAEAVDAGLIAGVHLEGPWLAEAFKGAHDAALLTAPTLPDVTALLDAARGTVRLVTIAPELAGALETIELLAQRGVVAAVGHTDADHAVTLAAIAAGARGTTHLFNAMPGLHHRYPGPVLALLADPRVWLELIVDGVHVASPLAAFVLHQFPDRVVLVTDAVAAAASHDGDYILGALPVEVRDGVARIAGTDTMAGSTLTLAGAVRNAVTAGVELGAALRAATSLPADYLGLAEVGRLRPGARADLVVLGEDLGVQRVLHRGTWVA